MDLEWRKPFQNGGCGTEGRPSREELPFLWMPAIVNNQWRQPGNRRAAGTAQRSSQQLAADPLLIARVQSDSSGSLSATTRPF